MKQKKTQTILQNYVRQIFRCEMMKPDLKS